MSFKSTLSRNTGKELPVWRSSSIGEGGAAAEFSLTVELAPSIVVSDCDVSAVPVPNGGTAPYTNVSFQWHSADDANGTNQANISGATSQSFYLPTSYNGDFIGCTVTVSDAAGSTKTVTEYSQAAVVTATTIATPSLIIPADASGTGTFTPQTSTSTSLTTANLPGGYTASNVGGSPGVALLNADVNTSNPATFVFVGGPNDGSSHSNNTRIWYTTGSTSLSQASISGSSSSVIRAIACDGSRWVAGGEADSGTKLWYSSNGTSWSAVSGLSYYRTFSVGSDGTYFYACTFSGSPSSHRSTNGGSSWSTTGAVGLGQYYSCVAAGKMYINPDGNNASAIRYVSSGGSVATATMTGGTSGQRWTGAASNPDGQIVLVHGASSGIWRSTNGGTTFSNVTGTTYHAFGGFGNSIANFGVNKFITNYGKVSTDGGLTWVTGSSINSALGAGTNLIVGSPTAFSGSNPAAAWVARIWTSQGKAAFTLTGVAPANTVSLTLQNNQVFNNSNGSVVARKLLDTFPTGTNVTNTAGNGTARVSQTPSGVTLELDNRNGTWTNGDRVISTGTVSFPGPYNNATTFTGSTPVLSRGIVSTWGNAEFQVSTSSGNYSGAMTDSIAITDETKNQTLPPTSQSNINMSTGTQYYARVRYTSSDPAQQSAYSTQNSFTTNTLAASDLPSGWTNTTFGANAFFRTGTTSPPSFPTNYEHNFGPVIDLPQTSVYRFMTTCVSRRTTNNYIYHFICRSVDGRSWELEDITQYMNFSSNSFSATEYLLNTASECFVWREGNEIAISYNQNQTRLGRGTYLYSNDLGESWSNIKIPLSSWQTAAYGNNQNPEPIDFSKRGSEYFIITRYGVSKHTSSPSASNWQAVQAYPKAQYINGFSNGIIWNSNYSIGFAHQGKISGSSANEPCITTNGGSTWAVPSNWNVGSTISGQTVTDLKAAIYLVSENRVLVQNKESSTKSCIFMFTMDGNASGISVIQTSTAQSEIMNASFASRNPVNGNIAFIGYGEQSSSTSKLLLKTSFTVGNPTGWTYSEFDSSNRGGNGSYNQMGELVCAANQSWNSNPGL